jgi:pimeloyl-ACP methyl ester carboxylesterase
MVDPERLDVPVPNEGAVAVWCRGAGPALVLVHGSMCDHTTFDALVEALGGDFATFALDRRGFGASADGGGYSADREFDDVATVVDAVAARAGGPVTLFGHSWGASCALGAAARSTQVGRLLLYEPSLGLRYPPGAIDRVESLVEAGDHQGAVVAVLTEIAGMADEDVAALRSSPVWPARVATGPTIAREARIEDGWALEAGPFAGLSAPTLVLTGSESPPELTDLAHRTADAIPGSRVHVLDGHDHFAYRFHPEVVAAVIRAFALQ